jgi:hypothetical protein
MSALSLRLPEIHRHIREIAKMEGVSKVDRSICEGGRGACVRIRSVTC